jgi:hypothetical protein
MLESPYGSQFFGRQGSPSLDTARDGVKLPVEPNGRGADAEVRPSSGSRRGLSAAGNLQKKDWGRDPTGGDISRHGIGPFTSRRLAHVTVQGNRGHV